MHTRWGHYAPCFVDGHIFNVTKATHPFITLHEKIPTLPVLVEVGGLTHEPQQRSPRHKAIHAF